MLIMLAKPTVHLNGSDGKRLMEKYQEAAAAIDTAIEKVHETQPHDRDYYVQKVSGYEAARAEHEHRVRRLTEIAEELRELSGSVLIQLEARKK